MKRGSLRITVNTDEPIYIGDNKEIEVRIRRHGFQFSVQVVAPVDVKIVRESAVNKEPKERVNNHD